MRSLASPGMHPPRVVDFVLFTVRVERVDTVSQALGVLGNESAYNNKHAPSKQSARLGAQPLRSDHLSANLLARSLRKLFVKRQSNGLNANVLSGGWMLEERSQDASWEEASSGNSRRDRVISGESSNPELERADLSPKLRDASLPSDGNKEVGLPRSDSLASLSNNLKGRRGSQKE